MTWIARRNIKFRSNKAQVNYEEGARISPKHEYIVKTYFSGQVLEEHVFRTKPISRNVKIDKKKTKSSYDEMKELIIDTKDSVDKIRELVGVLSKIKDVKKDKESHIELSFEVLSPHKEDINIEGEILENKTDGNKINNKIKKLKKLMEK